MCLGVPMRVMQVNGQIAFCEPMNGPEGAAEQIDLLLIDGCSAGSYVLVYLGSAIRILDADEAKKISDALEALDAARKGDQFDHLLQDLIDREPTLPPHLQEQLEGESTNDTCTG